jgi:site-specific DNA-methyltransferase (adenine-specific)
LSVRILTGDALEMLRTLDDASVNCCVTSPPYFGLRDYGVDGQIGLEETPDEWCAKLVAVFREVRRVLRDDGTIWVNIGDSYCSTDKWGGGKNGNSGKHTVSDNDDVPSWACRTKKKPFPGIKPKDLIGAPWMLAFALRADGWYLRKDIVWHKPNPMPESVRDRPTTAHEYIFLLSKLARYWYDGDEIREDDSGQDHPRNVLHEPEPSGGVLSPHKGIRTKEGRNGLGRNARSVWTIPTQPYPEAHFATFPPELAKRIISAGCPPLGTVLDPFGGAGTTGLVADRLQRNAILIELNPEYVAMTKRRIEKEAGLFAEFAA